MKGEVPRGRSLLRSLIGVALVALASAGPARAGDEQAPAPPDSTRSAVDLADGVLREAVLAGPGDLPAGLSSAGGDSVVVEVVFRRGDAAEARDAIEDARGDPAITVPSELVQADVPLGELEGLEADPGVLYVRVPVDYSEPADAAEPKLEVLDPGQAGAFQGEQIQKTNAAAWHGAGVTGQGVKVGIIDSFSGTHYNSAVLAGEIPPVSGTFCMVETVNCTASIFTGGKHGIGVAEAVIDMAPSAQIYFASTRTAGDTLAALDYFASQGVQIVTRSQTGRYDGPGNGTGPIATVIQNGAVARGMFYLNSAGNGAGRNAATGSYWRGGSQDPDIDSWINFSGTDELMEFDCPSFLNGLRWNDFGEGAGATDYDLFLYDEVSNFPATPFASAQLAQGAGVEPIERINTYTCPTDDDAYMAIFRYSPGSSSADDTLEIMSNGAYVEHGSDAFSASGPMSDLNSPGAVSVGAVDPALGTTIANYSSEGPTNDGRIKPDLSAAACVQSLTYSPACFNGTSSSTPVTAGAAALLLSGGVATTPQQLKDYLLQRSTVDRGAAGPDNVYGQGELVLPDPRLALDRTGPVVTALNSKGKPGKQARLRYQASDENGVSQETVTVFKKSRRLATITSTQGESTGGPYAVRWKVPRRAKGKHRFCVDSVDPAGNAGAQTCAKLKIKKRKRR